MLLTKEVEIGLSGTNAKWFEIKGYDIPKYKDKNYVIRVKKGTKITVKVNDLPKNSTVKINLLCDYCLEKGKETIIKNIKYQNYIIRINRIDYNMKDCCNECKKIKIKNVIQEKYGVGNILQLKIIQEKIRNTNIIRYGAENPFQSIHIKNKIKETNLLRYGFVNPMQNNLIREKANNTLIRNGSFCSSKQQRYICNLLDGKLNYPVSRVFLDIAFPEDNIYLEYDGGFHDGSVQLGNMTEDDFKKKEQRRTFTLRDKGWKEVRIISKKDNIPTDLKLMEIISYAKEYLNKNHHFIIFDIDNSNIINSQGIFNYDFGELRKLNRNITK